jgi:carbon monoxide dehydrogenase subunit G
VLACGFIPVEGGMKVAGSYMIPALQDRVYALLQDPAVLARCMPGCESLDKIGEDEYAMRMKMLLGSMSGLFEGKVKISDPNPPLSFRLMVTGAGKIGFMKGEGVLTLAETGSQTELPQTSVPQTSVPQTSVPQTSVQYEGDVQVGGTIAAVGQRLIDTTAKMLIKRFFEKLQEAATPAAAD